MREINKAAQRSEHTPRVAVITKKLSARERRILRTIAALNAAAVRKEGN